MLNISEQLLSRAIIQENPEIENKKKKLVKEKEEFEEKLDQLQNQLLEDLANSSGNILQDSVSNNRNNKDFNSIFPFFL